jgi:hypothetical protein
MGTMSDTDQSLLETSAGADDAWEIDALAVDALGNTSPVTGFLASDPLAATVWAGEDQAALFAPAVSWLDAPGGKVSLAVSAAQTRAVEPATYELEIVATPGGLTRKLFRGWLKIAPAPGSAVALPVYTTVKDLRRYAGAWLDGLRDDEGTSTFLFQRHQARAWLDDLVTSKVRLHVGRWYIPQLDSQWWLSPTYRDTTVAGWLASGGLIVTDRVREMVARKALAYACEMQVSGEDADPWPARARFYHAGASRLARLTTIGLDTDADGIPNFAFNLGVTSMR